MYVVNIKSSHSFYFQKQPFADVLKISQYSTESTCVRVFFNNVAGLHGYNFIIRNSNTGFFLFILRNFSEQLFL